MVEKQSLYNSSVNKACCPLLPPGYCGSLNPQLYLTANHNVSCQKRPLINHFAFWENEIRSRSSCWTHDLFLFLFFSDVKKVLPESVPTLLNYIENIVLEKHPSL